MSGTLLGQSIVLTGPFQPGSVFDSTYTGFSDSRFTPSLATSDMVILDSTPGTSYALDFGAPVENPTFHLATMGSIIRFPAGTTVEKVSGESTLTVSGNTVTGQAVGSTDSNGTVRVVGTFSSLPFTADPNFGGSSPVDGIIIQIGGSVPPAAPPPSEPPPAPPAASDPPPTAPASDPPPTAGETVDTSPQNGTVKVQRPGETSFTRISDTVVIPVGSLVDATEGTVRITSAADALGNTQTGLFYGGIFQVLQPPGAALITELVLRGGSFAPCRQLRRASASRVKKSYVVRQLWGNATGRFRTRGRYASATVRGTIWRTADRCDGTSVSVRRGSVTVNDFPLHKTLVLRAPKTYVARARR
jgi:hypothetical protein